MRVFLHIGLHRTGTSSLQACLAENLVPLNQAGYSFWGPPVMRSAPFAQIVKKTRAVRDGSDPATLRNQRRMIAGNLEEAAWTGRDLIVSDENISGTMAINIQKGALYERAKLRLRVFSRLFDGHDLTTLITLRSYDEFWSSCYARSAGHDRLPPPAKATDLAMACGRGWHDVINDIRVAQKRGQVLVRAYQPGLDPRDVLQNLYGIPQAQLFRLTNPVINQAPDDATVRRAVGETGINGALFTLFNDQQKAALKARYDADLAKIAQMPHMGRNMADLDVGQAAPATASERMM